MQRAPTMRARTAARRTPSSPDAAANLATLDQHCREIEARARAAGWQVIEARSIPYGRLMRFERAGAAAVLNVYLGRKGLRLVPGGRDGELLAVDVGLSGPSDAAPATGRASDPFGVGLPRIGADESGKGDWLGPLVVAAVAVDEERVAALRALGVDDSKKVADSRARFLAGRIEALGGHATRSLAPRAYNEQYARIGNLNVLLARLHAQCIRDVMAAEAEAGRPLPAVVLVDRFATNDRELSSALDLPRGTRLVTRPRAEADPAVAAASLLARAAFLDGLDELAHEHGASFPPGAGPPVLRAGVDLVRAFGPDVLPAVAKMHFATTGQVLQRARR